MNSDYFLSAPSLFKKLKSNEKGLSTNEAAKRLAIYGPNEIREENKWVALKILWAQFWNIMVGVLGLGMIVSFWLGESLDAYAIGIIIFINAGIGFFQEYRAEEAVEALKKMTAPFALVYRDGVLQKAPARELVPGDVLSIEEGTQVPADALLIEATQLQTIESSLTGESTATEKTVSPVNKAESLGDLKHRLFMGTTVSQGHGYALVTATGMETEFGKIAKLVKEQTDGATPLQIQLNRLTRVLAGSTLVIIILLFILALITGKPVGEMFLLSISLGVSVIPEGLPAVITLTLALGVQRIVKQKAVIRKLSAAETLGSTSVICTDKTGTLTQNQMTVKHYYANGEWIPVEGNSYEPSPLFKPQKNNLILLQTAALCNNSKLFQTNKGWEISGDPTEAALLVWAKKGGVDLENLNKEFTRKSELIFDSNRKRMSTVNKNSLFTKGSSDGLLEVCSTYWEAGKIVRLSPAKKRALLKETDQMAAQGYRILGLAMKKMKAGEKPVENNLTFLGMVALMDPPREEVKKAIQTCKAAHIDVIMITGDHALTAKAIGQQIGLCEESDKVLTGNELETLSESKLKKVLKTVHVFARVSPQHKVKILKALQSDGHIVAMTGDGVNDAPALKRANIGVAMGITGTDVSKEASDMILMDDNFSTIVSTIEEGRVIYRNIKKFIRFLLSANFDEILVISVIFLLGGPLPFLPLQILWVNLLTDALPAIALGIDSSEGNLMELRPRPVREPIWKNLLGFCVVAGTISAIVSLAFYLLHDADKSVEHLRSLLTTIVVVFEMMLVFSVRWTDKSCFYKFFSNKFLLLGVGISIALQCLALYQPFFQELLGMTALTLFDWLQIAGLCSLGVLILELWKMHTPKPKTV